MNAKAETAGSLDSLKWVLIVAIAAGGIAANVYFSAEPLLYRVLGLVVLAAMGVFIALQTTQGAAFAKLAKEARVEIRKVVWPTRQESTQTTLIVVVFVIVAALILWGLDALLGWLASLVIG